MIFDIFFWIMLVIIGIASVMTLHEARRSREILEDIATGMMIDPSMKGTPK